MDGLSAAVNIIALATALKDIVELWGKVQDSFGKVEKNRNSLLTIAVEIFRTVELFRSLVQRQSDVFDLPSFQEPLYQLEDELTYLFNRCKNLWSKNSGLGGKREFLHAWKGANLIKKEIDNLEKQVKYCHERFMLQITTQIYINSEEQKRRTNTSNSTETRGRNDFRDNDAFEELVGISQGEKPKLKEAWRRASKHVNSEDLSRVERYLNLKALELLKANEQKLLTDGGEGIKLELLLKKPINRTQEKTDVGGTKRSGQNTSNNVNEDRWTDQPNLPHSPIDGPHVCALHKQALQLFNSGYKEEAVIVMEEVLEQFNSLRESSAQTDRLNYLRSYADCLAAVGRHEDAIVVMENITEQFNVLLESDSADILLDQQKYLQAYEECLYAVSRHEEAAEQCRKEVILLRVLVRRFSEGYNCNLAVGLVNTSARMHALEKYDEALQCGLEGLQILREIENNDSSTSNPSIPRALLRLVFICVDLNRNKEALTYAREAAEKIRLLSIHHPDHPDTYVAEFATCLCYLARCLSLVGNHEDAAKTAAEAMPIYRSFVYRFTDQKKRGIIEKLLQHSKFFLTAGSYQAALLCSQLGVNVRRDFTVFGSESADPEFALSLRHLSRCLFWVGNREETALETIREAICIHEFLKGRDPKTYEERLAWDLAWLVQMLCSMKQYNTAFVPARRAVEMYRQFARNHPSTDNSQALIYALQQFLDCLQALGRDAEIRPVEEEIRMLKLEGHTNA